MATTAYPGGLRKRGGLLDYEDTIKPTPRNPFLGGVADLLGQAYKLPEMPRMGVPGLDFVAANRNRLMDLLDIGSVQKTAEAMAYGNRLGTGRGMTYRPLPETMGAAMAVAPFAGKAIRATEGLPVGASIKLVDDVAPQAEAMRLAQQRAALPVEQGGLGLLESNTAMDRAKAMGFDKKSVFHGSANRFDAFDPFLLGTNTGAPDANMGFHFAGSRGDAEFYATMAAEKLQKKLTGDGYGASGYVGEYLTKSKNPLVVDDLDSPLLDKFLAFEQAKKNNNDSIVFPYGTSVDSDYTSILFDPDNIRLKDAAFDPFRRNAAIAAAMGVAAPDLLAAETPEELKRRQMRGLLAP